MALSFLLAVFLLLFEHKWKLWRLTRELNCDDPAGKKLPIVVGSWDAIYYFHGRLIVFYVNYNVMALLCWKTSSKGDFD